MSSTTATAEPVGAIWSQGSVKVSEAARRFGMGRTTLYELMNSGRLPYSQVGATRLIPVVAIEALLQAGMKGGGGAAQA